MYNLLTCSGFDTGFFGGCSMAWLSFAIILFLAMIVRRQCQDGFLAGTGFNFAAALIGGLGANILMSTLTGSARWSLLLGVAGVAVGGYIVGLIAPSEDNTDMDGGE